MKKLLVLSVMVWSWALSPTLSYAKRSDTISLKCKASENGSDRFYALDTAKGTAKDLNMEPPEIGKLKSGETSYRLDFSKSKEKKHRKEFMIHRYDGSYLLRLGLTHQEYGFCEKITGPKF
jgi:hypothetical protein